MDIISLVNYLGEARIQMPSGHEGVAVLFPQRKVLVTHRIKHRDDRNVASCKPQRAIPVPLT
jgi:hypothetical protein